MIDIRIANRCLWGVNILLGLGIVLFALRYLAAPPTVDLLRDLDRSAALPSPPLAPRETPLEEALVTLRNPLRPQAGPPAPPPFPGSLKGALPSRDLHQGVAFLKCGDAELIVGMGEELPRNSGWRLAELWKDRAWFTNPRGERCELELEPLRPPQPPDRARTTPRIGEAYSSLPR
jgi:hypothetical protein